MTISSPPLSFQRSSMPVPSPVPITSPSLPAGSSSIVYCEGQFGEQDGKTANGLVRHSERYDVLSVIDSRHAGADAGTLLDGAPNGIPVLADLAEAVAHAGHVPDYLICGLAPADGLLSPAQRVVLLDGIAQGMHVINGLHEFLNDDAEFVGGRPPARRDHHRRTSSSGQEGPAALLRTHLQRDLPSDSRARHRRSDRQADHRDPAGPGPPRREESGPSWSARARPRSSRAASTAWPWTRSSRSSARARSRTRSSRPSRARTPT